MSDLEQRQALRFLVLQAAYELSGGNPRKEFRQQDIEQAVDLSQAEVDALILYLKNEGLLALRTLGRVYEITDAGLTEYRAAVGQPEVPSRYFPPINTIRVDRVGRSQLLQETAADDQIDSGDAPAPLPAAESDAQASPSVASAQTEPTNKGFKFAAIDALVREIRAETLTLSQTDRDTLDSDLATIEAQLRRPQPLRSIISESFGSARTIVERAGATSLANQIAHLVLEMAMWIEF